MSDMLIRYSTGEHASGTKGYALVQIQNVRTGAGLVVKFWGKTGNLVQCKVDAFSGKQQAIGRGATAEFDKAFDERIGRSYKMSRPARLDAKGLSDLRAIKGNPAVQKIPALELSNVWADCVIPEDLKHRFQMFDDQRVQRIKGDFEAAKAAQNEPTPEEIETMKSIPYYGMF